MSYNSKYTGEQVEGYLDQIANGEIGGGIEVETDPIFSASPAATITNEDKTSWSGKQDAISDLETIRDGASKGATALQSVPEEYVTEDQLIWVKVEGEAGVRLKGTNGTATGNLAISAGDDKKASDGTQFVSAASGDHAVVFGFGNTCAGRSTLAQGLYNTVNGKDSVAFGQRNLVEGDQAFAAGQQNEVTARLGVAIGYKNKTTNTDSIAIGYQNTSSGSASVAMGDTCEASGTSSTAMGYKTKSTGAYSSTFGQNTQATNSGEVAMGVYNKSTTSTDASEQTSFSFGIGTSDTNRKNALEIKKNGDVYIGDKLLSVEDFMTAEDLADVATSGSYNDLSDKPTIPSAINIAGTNYLPSAEGIIDLNPAYLYRKPSDGIPKTDLSSEVQTALTNADTYKGTVTGVKINGTTKSASNGIVDLGNIPTSIPTEVYVADFTMESLKEGMYNGTQVDCNMQGLITAMEADKVILVRESEDSAYRGVHVLNGYIEDLLYFSIVDTQGDILYCEGTAYGAEVNYINGASLHLQSWDGKQDALVSGNNIKTINGESILGSGDIEISGGSGEQGPQGPQGEQGPKGEDGVGIASVKQTTTSSADSGTNVVTVTLSNGTTSTFNIKNGSKGSNGSNGTNGKDGADGEDGATFTPSVDSAGNLSWSNNKGLANPPTVNIKGPKGDAGSGGGGSSSSSAKEFVVKEPDSDPSGNIGAFLHDDPLQPNKVYVFSQPIYSLYIAYINESMGAGDEYTIMFTSDGATSILIGADYQVYWANGVIPTISNGDMCELSLVRIGSVLKAVLSIFKAE